MPQRPAGAGVRRPRDDDDGRAGLNRRPSQRALVGGEEDRLISMKRSFNKCPICKMPIYVDPDSVHTRDQAWRHVQFYFKGKPSFILDDLPDSNGPRNKQCFGKVSPVGMQSGNEADCHYVHVSVSIGSARFYGLWAHFDQDFLHDVSRDVTVFPGETPVHTMTFSNELNITHSVFQGTEPTDAAHMLDPFLWVSTSNAFAQGDRVKAQYRDGNWYPAVIAALNADGTYKIGRAHV